MSWSLYRWVWKLRGPLSAGLPPAGALNRSRLYVPARTVWAAITAELAQSRSRDFADQGQELLECARFSYLFPAETGAQSWKAWLPRFDVGQGVVWTREDAGAALRSVPDHEFRLGLLDARAGTAIAPETDSAADGTLRETECISTRWRNGRAGDGAAVALIGYLFENKDISLRAIETLFLGGDSRYGLGRVELVSREAAGDVFGAEVRLEEDGPTVTSHRALAHAAATVPMAGALEHLTGWDRARAGLRSIRARPLWVPGSVTVDGTPAHWRVEPDGIWSSLDDSAEGAGSSAARARSTDSED